MEPLPPPPIKSLLVLHFTLLAGQVVFLLIAMLLVILNIFPEQLGRYAPQLILTAALLEIVAFLIARLFFKRRLKSINKSTRHLSEKLALYRGANIIRWGILEGAVLITIALFLLTNQWLILIIAVALMFIFFTTRPTAPVIATDLGVSETEIMQLD